MLRRATADDAPKIAAVLRRSLGTLTFLPAVHTPEQDVAFVARVIRDDEVWTWEQDDGIVAFAALGADRLEHLYVDPAVQGRGIGALLLAHMKERRPGGFDLWTFQRNEGARRFYERHDFRPVEFTDGSGNDEREPDVRLEWRP